MAANHGSTNGKPGGQMTGLDFDQPVVNIGGDPANDIALSGEGVRPFHAALLVSEDEYRLVSLAPESEILLDGKPMTGPMAVIHQDQRVELGSYSLFVKPNGTPTSVHVLLSRLDVPEPGLPARKPPRVVWRGEAGEILILTKVISQQLTVMVKQTAYVELEVINGGPIVANFDLAVEGVPQDWVKIAPPEVNLNEDQRAAMRVEITPPQDPQSAAGKHPFKLIVTSPEYEGQVSEVPLDLVIQPYYQFELGKLEPKSQKIAWRKRTGRVVVPIANQGNSEASFEVLALDDENGCTFEIYTSPEQAYSRHAVVSIPAGAEQLVPVDITPSHQPMISMRNREYHFTTTVSLAEQANSTQMLSGRASSQPLFGWWSIVLTALVLLAALFYLVQPRINRFEVANNRVVIDQGETTDLEWQVSPFATRLTISGVENLNRSQNRATVGPEESTNYEMVAGNWLSGMLNLDQRWARTVLVVPPTPKVNIFSVDSKKVLKGVPTTIRWSVSQADTAVLTIANLVEELPPAQFTGVRELILKEDTLVTLEAKNASGSQLRSYYINVQEPQIFIEEFLVCRRPAAGSKKATAPSPCSSGDTQTDFTEPYVGLVQGANKVYRVEYYQQETGGFQSELDKGEQVLVIWKISGTESVQIAPFNETLPNEGQQPFFPQQSMNLVLTAEIGEKSELQMLPIRVFDGQPPVAPTIDFFKASPSAIVGPGEVQFAWSISGAWTKITLTMGSTIIASDGLKPQDFRAVKVDKTSTFILTAWNGNLSKAETLEVIVNPALKRTALTVEDVTPYYTYFQVGDTVEVVVKILGLDQEPGTPAPTGKITVTDGTAVCSIDLPLNRCKLTFTSPGNKTIKAAYSGDKVYLPSQDVTYTKGTVIVDANMVELTMGFYAPGMKDVSGNDVQPKLLQKSASIAGQGWEISAQTADIYLRQLGQGLMIDVSVIPLNKPIDDNNGEVTVRYCELDAQGKRIDTKCMVAGPIAVTKPTDPINPVGSAKVVIGQFSKMGKFGLVISYRHKQDAFMPVLVGAEEDDQILVDVQKGRLVMVVTDPVLQGYELCTYKLCRLAQDNSADIIIGPMLMVDEQNPATTEDDVLAAVYPVYPPVGQVNITAQALADIPRAWTDKCGWQVVGVHQLYCSSVPLNKETVLTFEIPAAAGSSYELFGGAEQATLKIRAGSSFLIDPGVTDTTRHYVGKKMQLLGGNIRLIGDNMAIAGQFTISKVGGNIADDVVVVSGAQCQMDGSAIKLNQSLTPASDSCVVYFKREGALDLELKYEGTKEYGGVTSTQRITVNKQNGISVQWDATPASKRIFAFGTLTAKLSFRCSNTASCGTAPLDFDYAAIKDAKLLLTPGINPTACTVTKDGAPLDANGTIIIPAKGSNTYPEVNLAFYCTQAGTPSYSLAFDTFTSAKDFGFDPGAADNGSSFNFVVDKIQLNQTLIVTRDSLTQNLVTQDPLTSLWSISALQAGSAYHFTITLSNVPAGLTLNASTDWIEMRLPEKLAKSISYTAPDTTCVWDEGGYFFKFAVSLQNGVWKSTTCKIFVNLPGTLDAGSKLLFSFTNQQVEITPTEFSLPAEITAPQGWIVPDLKIVNPNGDWPTIYSSAAPLFVGEIYELSMRTTYSGYTTYTPYFEIPAEVRSVLVADTSKSTCLANVDPSNSSRFFVTWVNVNGTYVASCRIQLQSLPSTTTGKKLTYGLSYSYVECAEWVLWWCVRTRVVNVYINLFETTKNIEKRPVKGLDTASLPNSVTTGKYEWYAGTSPYIDFTIADDHYQYNAIDERLAGNAVPWSANVGGTALTCARQGTTSTIRCNIPDSTPVTNATLTLNYSTTANFAQTSHSYTFSILRIPTRITLADIELVQPTTSPSGKFFPEYYQQENTTTNPKPRFYYLLTEQAYRVRVQVKSDVTGVPGPDAGTVTLNVTVKNGDGSDFWSTSLTADANATNRGDVTFSDFTIPFSVTQGGTTRHLWGATATFSVSYAGSTKYFSTSCCANMNNVTIMVRRKLSFTPENVQDQSNKGFAVNNVILPLAANTPLKEAYTGITGEEKRYCLDVFFEAGTTALNCDGKSCWTRNVTDETVAVFCDADSAPLADTGWTYKTDTTTDEKIYVADANFNLGSVKYQIILMSKRFLGIVVLNWP
jgi:hypothetical protein